MSVKPSFGMEAGHRRLLHVDGEANLGAGGSLLRDDATRHPRLARRVWLLGELGLFYIGAPLAIAWGIKALHVPLFLMLMPILGLLPTPAEGTPSSSPRQQKVRGQ